MPEPSAPRKRHFEAHCLAWTALNHFLPADLLRELAQALVESVGGGQFQLGQLFEEELVGGLRGLESWAVRPLDVKDPLAKHLQNRIRYLIWANDTELFYDDKETRPTGLVSPAALEAAVRLGQCDLNVLDQVVSRLNLPPQTSAETLLSVMKKTNELRTAPDMCRATVYSLRRPR